MHLPKIFKCEGWLQVRAKVRSKDNCEGWVKGQWLRSEVRFTVRVGLEVRAKVRSKVNCEGWVRGQG